MTVGELMALLSQQPLDREVVVTYVFESELYKPESVSVEEAMIPHHHRDYIYLARHYKTNPEYQNDESFDVLIIKTT